MYKVMIVVAQDGLEHTEANQFYQHLLETAPPNVEVVLQEVTAELNGLSADVVYIDELKTNCSILLPPKTLNISVEVEQKRKQKVTKDRTSFTNNK